MKQTVIVTVEGEDPAYVRTHAEAHTHGPEIAEWVRHFINQADGDLSNLEFRKYVRERCEYVLALYFTGVPEDVRAHLLTGVHRNTVDVIRNPDAEEHPNAVIAKQAVSTRYCVVGLLEPVLHRLAKEGKRIRCLWADPERGGK